MELSTLLENSKKLKCNCRGCTVTPERALQDFRVVFPELDAQQLEGALLIHLTENLKLVLSHAPTKHWLARLVIGEEVTDINKTSISPTNAAFYLFNALWGIRAYLTDELRQFALESHERSLEAS